MLITDKVGIKECCPPRTGSKCVSLLLLCTLPCGQLPENFFSPSRSAKIHTTKSFFITSFRGFQKSREKFKIARSCLADWKKQNFIGSVCP